MIVGPLNEQGEGSEYQEGAWWWLISCVDSRCRSHLSYIPTNLHTSSSLSLPIYRHGQRGITNIQGWLCWSQASWQD